MKIAGCHNSYKWVALFLLTWWFAAAATGQNTVHVIEGENTSYFNRIDSVRYEKAQVRKVPDSVINRLQKEEAFWYANVDRQQPVPKNTATPWVLQILQQPWLRTLLWVFITGAFVVVLLWYLRHLNLQLFRQKSTLINADHHTGITEDIFSLPYISAIEKAENEGNNRMAIRLHFLQLLAQLAKEGRIQYAQDKTNSDYLQQMRGTNDFERFSKLTRHFEYAWYGQFAITDGMYTAIKKEFVTFNRPQPA